MPVDVLIDENGTIDAIISISACKVEIVAVVEADGDTMTLDGVHLERISGATLTRTVIARLCAEICRHFRVKKLVVQGARRTTGKSAGSIPSPITYEAPK
jgi:hypothetical protein